MKNSINYNFKIFILMVIQDKYKFNVAENKNIKASYNSFWIHSNIIL